MTFDEWVKTVFERKFHIQECKAGDLIRAVDCDGEISASINGAEAGIVGDTIIHPSRMSWPPQVRLREDCQ